MSLIGRKMVLLEPQILSQDKLLMEQNCFLKELKGWLESESMQEILFFSPLENAKANNLLSKMAPLFEEYNKIKI